MKKLTIVGLINLTGVLCIWSTGLETKVPKYATDIPPSITSPDSVETRLGTLKFFDGMPDEKTAQLAYDNLDFQRGVRVFHNTIAIASMHSMREGIREGGVANNNMIGITENLLDSGPRFLTGNTVTYYVMNWLDLSWTLDDLKKN